MEEQECLIMPLGAGNEVGRSCIYLAWQGKKILLDCGIHPAYNGLAGLPYFDMINPDEIDIVLITHFHLDHVGALPYFLERTTFKGKVFMTHPTKAIYKWLLLDYVKVSNVGNDDEDVLYSERDLLQSYDKIQVSYKQCHRRLFP
jgi:cleavage and polyadenylation specificity factor subunit 3